jgi:RNA polymerase sigma-70 factor (ECF subfamily)
MESQTIICSIQPDYSTIATAKLIEVGTRGDAAAWLEFINRFHGIIAVTACRAARRWGEAHLQTIDDLIQETYLKLCADRGRILRQCRLEHEDVIPGFLKLVTDSVADDYFRALYAAKRRWNSPSTPRDGSEIKSDTDRAAELMDPERNLPVDRIDLYMRDMPPAETTDRDRI